MKHLRSAFTLVEMLVVIGIIGILSAVMLVSFSGSSESARAARCLTNMRNLAAAAQTYAMSTSYFPPAGTGCLAEMTSGSRRHSYTYSLIPGWISWSSASMVFKGANSPLGNASMNISTYEPTQVIRDNAITNGALWKYVSGNRSVYLCPTHAKEKQNLNPLWSYVMSAYFGWTVQPGTGTFTERWNYQRTYANFPRSDRFLLFAELPFSTEVHTGSSATLPANEETSAGNSCDCILQYQDSGGGDSEFIGFNHKNGKRPCAHVAFADGHCEKLAYPKDGMSQSQAVELTEWLCKGYDISFDGKKYEQLTDGK